MVEKGPAAPWKRQRREPATEATPAEAATLTFRVDALRSETY
jgi:hypothetical protein